jgi:hypothetical protein
MVHAGRILGAVALLGIAAATPACGDDGPDHVVVVEPTGTLTFDYTIYGDTDPADCAYYGATDVELVVYDDLGYFVADAYAPCEVFTVGIDLYPGYYSADLTLVDPYNNAVSVTSPHDDLRVVSDTELVVNVDFPPGSFL